MSADSHEHHDHTQHYVKIWGVLLVLLVISIAGPMFEVLIVTLVTAFGIAIVKAYLVAKHFMHLDVEQPIIHYFLATALVFMLLLFAGVAPDVMNHEGDGWENLAAKEAVQRDEQHDDGGDATHH